jgi:CheY-like chemotaxis protein
MINGREKIVVVEADAASRDLLLAAIQSAGYEVVAFATAREGLEAARQPGTDLLVLDAAVADSNVFSAHEIVATIRGSAVTEGVRVIVLTRPGAGERAAGLDLGADDAISRPCCSPGSGPNCGCGALTSSFWTRCTWPKKANRSRTRLLTRWRSRRK